MTDLYSVHDLTEHLIHDRDDYLNLHTQHRCLSPLQPDTVAAMRALIDLPDDTPMREASVLLQHGDEVARHTHPEWVALWYVMLGSPPQPLIIEDGDDRITVTPRPGECVVIPPNVWHYVEPSTSLSGRLLFGVLVGE